jgi:hypothetical protein
MTDFCVEVSINHSSTPNNHTSRKYVCSNQRCLIRFWPLYSSQIEYMVLSSLVFANLICEMLTSYLQVSTSRPEVNYSKSTSTLLVLKNLITLCTIVRQ